MKTTQKCFEACADIVKHARCFMTIVLCSPWGSLKTNTIKVRETFSVKNRLCHCLLHAKPPAKPFHWTHKNKTLNCALTLDETQKHLISIAGNCANAGLGTSRNVRHPLCQFQNLQTALSLKEICINTLDISMSQFVVSASEKLNVWISKPKHQIYNFSLANDKTGPEKSIKMCFMYSLSHK